MTGPKNEIRRRQLGTCLILVILASGCDPDQSIPEGTRFDDPIACGVTAFALCAIEGAPRVYRDGDPGSEVCLAVQEDIYFGQTSSIFPFKGTTRVTAEYDDAGRVVAVSTDCGLEDPRQSTLTWNAEGRLIEFRTAPYALYASKQQVFRYSPGLVEIEHRSFATIADAVHRLVIDSEGRMITTIYDERLEDAVVSSLEMDFEYDGDLLVSWADRDNPPFYGYVYEYEDGRVMTMHRPTGELSFTFDWKSSTELSIHRFDNTKRVDLEFDAAGRPVRKDMHEDGDWIGVQTWEWEDDGRLREFVHHVP